jgi:glycosyltransferase involved in cell wall biosynthesis
LSGRHAEVSAPTVPSTSFAIVANGFAEGPAQALRDYLVGEGASVVTVLHPLTPEQGTTHRVTRYEAGGPVAARSIDLRVRPPLSFATDPLVPLRLPRVDVWVGFNPLACARGLAQRRLRRARRVVLWSVDFVPDRFGRGKPLTKLYNGLDRFGCTHADARVELSEAARVARNRHHGLDAGRVPTLVVPMGAWLDRVPTVAPDGYASRRVVFLGHLVPRQGVSTLLEAVSLLRARGEMVAVDLIGGGPEEPRLRARAHALGLDGVVRFHGFVPDHRDVERILADSSLAVAPYEPDPASFTRHADPGKLKAYLAAGLPTVLTDVPPNARELAAHAGAQIVDSRPAALADAISDTLASPQQWRVRSDCARDYVRRFDWPVLLRSACVELDLLES